MRLGAHMSAAGGVYKAFERGQEASCESMLVFTKSNRQWNAKPLTVEDIDAYKKAEAEHDIFPVAVHASYLINVASPDEALWEKSYQALKEEVERAGLLGIPLLTFHPGSYVSGDEATGLANIARALRRLVEETAVTAPNVTVCLETMAGQGTNLGCKFEHLAQLLEDSGSDRIGVCFDTCHVFAAGYDIRTPETYAKTMAEFDRIIGLNHIKTFHFNDSKFELGSQKDRHAHIGDGFIGLDGFANFVNDPRWANHSAHLETPKTEEDEDGNEIEMDPVNLARLRELITK
ncbi:MAG: deoxyribonuclease IV [Ardenticatenaceae bacterium]|nr:deoxyribonuclease IV [Ardenticatenaceae bacterium]MCB9443760.1 deoxyribonuclease IV [Ardenticatenaceae bacterium]